MKPRILLLTVFLCAAPWGWARQASPAAKPRPPLLLFPACPCYHVLGRGNGDTRIDARVTLPPARLAGARLAVELSGAGGRSLQSGTADASGGGIVGLNLRVPVQAVAAFGVTARLLDSAGGEIARAETDVHVCPAELARVAIGPDGFPHIGGQPQFTVGLYSAIRYEEIGRAGFTATHNYGITAGPAGDAINPNDGRLKDLLDLSYSNGMRMMVEVPRPAVEQAQWAQVRRRIETFRNHPGLLCWGSEERVARGRAPLANIAALYQLVGELDPNHPFVLGDSRDIGKNLVKDRRDFFPENDMDVGIWWWYPIPLQSGDLLEPPSWLTTTRCKKPLWIAIQAYKKPPPSARYPTPAEYRCLAYLSVINGVKGLFFYTGSGQLDVNKKPAGLLNRPEDSHWDYVQTLVRELRQFSPVILAPASRARLALSPTNVPVEFAARELDGKLYLIAASKSPLPQSVRFGGEALKGRSARVLFETGAAAIDGDGLAAQFEPFGVHLYRIE
jgi:hypothetical protein